MGLVQAAATGFNQGFISIFGAKMIVNVVKSYESGTVTQNMAQEGQEMQNFLAIKLNTFMEANELRSR